MNDTIMYIAIALFIAILVSGIFLVLKYTKKEKLTDEQVTFLNKQFKKIIRDIDEKSQIIHLDKLYHKTLVEFGFSWTFWEILKSKPEQIWDIQKIWELHKLRNKLVHDFDNHEVIYLKKKSKEFQTEWKKLLSELT